MELSSRLPVNVQQLPKGAVALIFGLVMVLAAPECQAQSRAQSAADPYFTPAAKPVSRVPSVDAGEWIPPTFKGPLKSASATMPAAIGKPPTLNWDATLKTGCATTPCLDSNCQSAACKHGTPKAIVDAWTPPATVTAAKPARTIIRQQTATKSADATAITDSSVSKAAFEMPVAKPVASSPKPKAVVKAAALKDIPKNNAAPINAVKKIGAVDDSSKGGPKVVATGFTAPAAPAIPAAPAVPAEEQFEQSRVLALVGGEPIFVGDMILEVNQLIEKFMAGAPDEIKAEQRDVLMQRLLPKYIDNKMLYISSLEDLPEGADLDKILTGAASEFDEKALPGLIKESGVKNISQFEANLRAQGSSLSQMRSNWARDQLTKFFLSQQLKINTTVNHQMMLDEYHKNLADYETVAKSKWEQIMIRFDRGGGRESAKAKAEGLLDKVVHGANFEALAKAESHGFRASSGGQHDWTTRNALVLKEIDEAIFTQPIGRLSDLIESRDGYHIVRVIDRQDAGHVPFREAQVKIKERIQNDSREQAFKKHIEKLKAEIPVKYFTIPMRPTQTANQKSAGPQMSPR